MESNWTDLIYLIVITIIIGYLPSLFAARILKNRQLQALL